MHNPKTIYNGFLVIFEKRPELNGGEAKSLYTWSETIWTFQFLDLLGPCRLIYEALPPQYNNDK